MLGDEPKVVLAESGDAASLQLRRGGGRSGGAGPCGGGGGGGRIRD